MKLWKRTFVVLLAFGLVGSFGQAASAAQPPDPPAGVAKQGPDPDPDLNEDKSKPETDEAEKADEQGGSESENSESENPENVEPVETDAPADESGDPAAEPGTNKPGATEGNAAEGEAAEVTSAPETLEVSGKLRVFPAEPTQGSIERQAQAHDHEQKNPNKKKAAKEIPIEEQRFELSPEDVPEESFASESGEDHEALETVPGMVLLETEQGDTLPLGPTVVDSDAVSGSTFTGTVAVEATAKESVKEAIAAAPAQALTESEVVGVAAEATIAADETFAVLDSEITPLPAPAPTSGAVMHSADVVLFTNEATSQVAAVQELMTITSNYWKNETEGLVAGIKVNAIKQEKASGLDVCNPFVSWERARQLFQNANYYTNAKHLVVLVDVRCSVGDAVGWGDIDTLHGGGQTWTNLGARPVDTPMKSAVQTLQHEIGHNLGLNHSGARSCSDPRVSDTSLANVRLYRPGSNEPAKLCNDSEYADSWSAMGYAVYDLNSNTPSLPIGQKDKLGVLPAGAVIDAKSSNGVTQRFTINALSSRSGLRGVRVQQSGTSEKFYLEYRNGAGSDANVVKTRPESKGVRVLKEREDIGIEIRTPAGTALSVGQSLHPYGGRARVTVESMTSAQAVVRVDFSTSFTDVLLSDRFSGSIQWMYDRKISTGSLQPDKSVMYGPLVDVSREAVAAFLFRAYAPAGYVPGAKGKLPFADITTSHRFYKEIYWMWERGITTGTLQPDGTRKYLPGDPLTREAMSAFLYRAEGANYAPPARSPFVDVATTNMFYKYVAWMYAKGISTGTVTSAGREYRPKTNTTRETMAPFLQRASQI